MDRQNEHTKEKVRLPLFTFHGMFRSLWQTFIVLVKFDPVPASSGRSADSSSGRDGCEVMSYFALCRLQDIIWLHVRCTSALRFLLIIRVIRARSRVSFFTLASPTQQVGATDRLSTLAGRARHRHIEGWIRQTKWTDLFAAFFLSCICINCPEEVRYMFIKGGGVCVRERAPTNVTLMIKWCL